MSSPKDSVLSTERIFDIPVHAGSRDEILETIDENIRGARDRCYISITSSELMYNARRSSFLPEYIKGAQFSLVDSIGVVIAARARGAKIHRFTGPMLMESCCRYGVSRNWRHFFCGGADGVAKLLSDALTERFPGLITAGTYCPPFRALSPEEEENMLARINETKPDMLWIGLGVVKQETWIARYLERFDVPWTIGVGGAFDYHAGTIPWAPRWIGRIGMEWAYRLYKEPWRFKRILSAHVFTLEALMEGLLGRAPVLGGTRNIDRPPPSRGEGRA